MKLNGYEILQIILITLKLLNKIDLSWKMVFIPTYIMLGAFLIMILIGVYQEIKMKKVFDKWVKKR